MVERIAVTRTLTDDLHVLANRMRHDRMAEAFGRMVRDRREKRGLSIKQASVHSGVAWTNWKHVEEGGGTTVLTWVKIADTLGWELFVEVEEKG